MRILVTRPQKTLGALKKDLHDRGHSVLCAPLLIISPIFFNMNYDGVAALAFTSANGVRFVPNLQTALARNLAVYAVGPRTAITAKEVGFDVVLQAAGDMEALKSLIYQSQPKDEGRIIHFSGVVTKGDLAGDLREAGYDAQRVEVYDARAVDALSDELLHDLEKGCTNMALFYSARTMAIFMVLVERAGLLGQLAGVHCVCLSQAVADLAKAAEWRGVHVADAPDEPSMLRLVDELSGGTAR
ncbi:MAG: uroporphyrinogen-III synthase [Sphingomonadales bacterium]|nr:uroporphyrinogen-III synthase [Sphingomonadales bacterium]